jgi:hypothetical protein
LLKRKGKDRRSGKEIQTYHIGFLNPNGKGYARMKATGIKVGTKEAERQADRLAQTWLQDGTVTIQNFDLREYFLEIWDKEKSEYLKSRQAETGRTYSSHYIYNNRLMVEDYFLPYFGERNIKTIVTIQHKPETARR